MQEDSEPKFAPVGQIANLLDGLTPSFRKRKRKVRRGRALRAHDFVVSPAPAKQKSRPLLVKYFALRQNVK